MKTKKELSPKIYKTSSGKYQIHLSKLKNYTIFTKERLLALFLNSTLPSVNANNV